MLKLNGGKLARSAGSSITLSGYDGDYAILKLSSGETRKVSSACTATIGVVSNPEKKNEGLSPLLLYLYLTFFCEFCESFGKRFSNCVVKLRKDVYLNTPIDQLEHA